MGRAEQTEAEWLAERPQVIRDMYAKCPPNALYKLKSTGQIVAIDSYLEDGTLRCGIISEHHRYSLCGIEPEDLENTNVNGEDFRSPEDVLAWAFQQRYNPIMVQ